MDQDAAQHDKIGFKLFILGCVENDNTWCCDGYYTDCVSHCEEEGELDHCAANRKVCHG